MSSSANNLKTKDTIDDNGSWKINIINGVTSIVAQGANTRNILKYNSQSSLFSCYGTNNTQPDVIIYKYISQEVPASQCATVTFVTNCDEQRESITNVKGFKLDMPSALTKEGYSFIGWYDHEECDGEQFDFENRSITENISLYAKWEEIVNNENVPVTVTVIIENYASKESWSNSAQYSSIEMDDIITVTANGGSNTGKYYTSGYNWRIYQSDSGEVTISASQGSTIKSIKITYTSDSAGTLVYNNDNISSDQILEVNNQNITLTMGNTGTGSKGQARITAIEVTYVTSQNN